MHMLFSMSLCVSVVYVVFYVMTCHLFTQDKLQQPWRSVRLKSWCGLFFNLGWSSENLQNIFDCVLPVSIILKKPLQGFHIISLSWQIHHNIIYLNFTITNFTQICIPQLLKCYRSVSHWMGLCHSILQKWWVVTKALISEARCIIGTCQYCFNGSNFVPTLTLQESEQKWGISSALGTERDRELHELLLGLAKLRSMRYLTSCGMIAHSCGWPQSAYWLMGLSPTLMF